MAKCWWCGQEISTPFGISFCSNKCMNDYRAAHPLLFNGPDLLDAGIDIVTSIHAAKKAKKEAEERAEREAERREREYWNSPEGRAKTAAYEAEKRAEERADNARSLEGWLEVIERIANGAVKEIEERKFSGETKNRTQYLEEAKTKIANAVTKAKSEVEKYWPVAAGTSTASYSAKANAKYKVKKARSDLKVNMARIDYWFFKKSTASPKISKLFIALSVLIPLGGIILGINQRVFMLPVIGFIAGYVLAEIAWRLYYKGKTKFPSLVTGVLGCPYLLIISIILGAALHSFRLGLIGVITSIVLFVVFMFTLS